MYSETEDVIRALAENAESVCRAYLPAGRREGSYWIVGDLQNNPGRSLFVRLTGPTSGPGARGKVAGCGGGTAWWIFSTSSASETGDLALSPISWPRPGRILAVPSRSSRIRQCRRRPKPPVAHASRGGAALCSLYASRRHACRHLPSLPGHHPKAAR